MTKTKPAPVKTKPTGESKVDNRTLAERLEGFSWVGDTLVVENDEALGRIRRKQISHSVASNVDKCPASFAIESVLPRVDGPFEANVLGNGAHLVLEALYDQEPQNRTKEFALAELEKVADDEWAEKKLPDRRKATKEANAANRQLWIDKVTPMVLGLWDLEDPTQQNVYKTELDIQGVKIGRGIPFRGYLDRTDIIGSDEHGDILSVKDYKSGKYNAPSPRFGDSNGDQMRLYAAATEQLLGRRPTHAQLLYIGARKQREVDLSEPAIKASLFWLEKSWDVMNRSADRREFNAQPSALCGWCKAVNSCPVAMVKTDKAKAQAAKAPAAVELGIPTFPALTGQKRPSGITNGASPQPGPTPAEAAAHLEQAPRIDQSEKAVEGSTTMSTEKYPTSEYAAIAAFSLTDVAAAHLNQQGQQLNRDNLLAFSRVLGGILERTSRSLFTTFGWEHGKTGRLSFALKGALYVLPAPFGGDADAWATWQKTISKFVVAKAQVSLELLETEFTLTDWEIFLPAEAETAAA